jgi:hypothetical protein
MRKTTDNTSFVALIVSKNYTIKQHSIIKIPTNIADRQ